MNIEFNKYNSTLSESFFYSGLIKLNKIFSNLINIYKLIQIILIPVLLFLIFSKSSAQQVSGINAFYKNGQTFITWKNLPLNNIYYKIYRSSIKLDDEGDFAKASYIGLAGESSSLNIRLSKIMGKNYYFRTDSSTKPLNETTGLFVETPLKEGSYYYAVIPVIGNKENRKIYPGSNSLTKPVFEKPAPVKPVWQTTVDDNNTKQEVYVHWSASVGNNHYTAMFPVESFAFNFSVIRIGTGEHHPLIATFHQFGGNFIKSVKFPVSESEIIISFDDWLPNGDYTTFWYGCGEKYNPYGQNGVLNTGIVRDYTVQRIKWNVLWATSHFMADPNRVYFTGRSMGGSGAVMLAMVMPNIVAATYAVVPKFDYSFLNDPDSTSIYNQGTQRRALLHKIWGNVATNLMTNDGIGVYQRLNAGWITRLFEDVSLPFLITFSGRNDSVVGWAEKSGFYKSYEESRQASIFYWDDRDHGKGGVRQWKKEENPAMIYRFRLNKSYPAFSNCSVDGTPGDGNENSGDLFGNINAMLDWSDDIVDSPGKYEITIKSKELLTGDHKILPPEKIRVNITLRRLQQFKIEQDGVYYYKNISLIGKVLQSGVIHPDKLCLLTIKNFIVTPFGNKLVISLNR